MGLGLVAAGVSLAVCARAQPPSGAASGPDPHQQTAAEQTLPTVPGFTWASDPDVLYAPAKEMAEALCLPNSGADEPTLQEQAAGLSDRRYLPDGTLLLPVRTLARLLGSTAVTWDTERSAALAACGERQVLVSRGWRSVVDGVTFAAEPKRLYVPRPEAERALTSPGAEPPDESRTATARDGIRTLPDGTALCSVEQLAGQEPDASLQTFDGGDCLSANERELWVLHGAKRVAINLEAQRLRAWQGERLVLDTRISSGRPGMDTPQGIFAAGPMKSRLVISHKYGDAEMPWSVQVHQNVFIHGFPSVPPRAASHGCIRVPLTGRNPARWFYRWVEIRTPIQITRKWPVAPSPVTDIR